MKQRAAADVASESRRGEIQPHWSADVAPEKPSYSSSLMQKSFSRATLGCDEQLVFGGGSVPCCLSLHGAWTVVLAHCPYLEEEKGKYEGILTCRPLTVYLCRVV